MKDANRPSPRAPLFDLEQAPTPDSAHETPAPSRDPPAEPASDSPADPAASAPVSDRAAEPPVSAPAGDLPAEPPVSAPAGDLPAEPPVSAPDPAGAPAAVPGASRAHRSPRPLHVPDSVARAVEACRPLALAVILRGGVPERDAPDVVQNLLIALLPRWAERDQWPPKQRLEYVAAAARIVASRYRWLAARRPESLKWGDILTDLQERAPHDEPELPSPEAQLLALEAEAELLGESHLHSLPASTAPAFWRVFHAYAVLGLSIADIALLEGAPVPTIYNRLRLARRDLQAAIRRRRASAAR